MGISQNPAHVEMVKIESRLSARTVPLTAELAPFLQADIEARSPGYVEKVFVNRGSQVHKGQLLVQLSAPESNSQTAASEASLHQVEAEVAQAEAQAAAAESTAAKLQEAAKTLGAVAGNELLQVQKQRDAAQALVDSRKAAVRAAKERLQNKPSDAVLSSCDRTVRWHDHRPIRKPWNAHRWRSHSYAQAPAGRPFTADRSRPETYTGSLAKGTSVMFHVPAQPGRSYTAKVARIPNALDQQSRSMMVELDVYNKDLGLAPGMYPTVDWPVSSGENLLFVHATSVVTTTERTFVIVSINGRAHWIDVQKGPTIGEAVSIRGQVAVNQLVVKRATDEVREGTPLNR